MENIIVAIVSCDRDYNRVLSVALTNACSELSVEIFDNREFVRLWSEYTGPGAFYDNFDIVLWAGEEICDSYSDNIIYLSNKLSQVKKDFRENRFCLYRYESVRSLIAAVFEIYTHLTGRTAAYAVNPNVRILGFSSGCGGIGCTTMTMAVAQELSRFHKKHVLYISLEDVESTGGFVCGNGGMKNTGEYLYRLLGGGCFKTELPALKLPFMDSYLIRNAFDIEAFAPSKGKNPLRELSSDDMKSFLLSLMDCGRYDVIAIDMSTCLTDAGITAMEMADCICLVSGQRSPSGRENIYLNQIVCCLGENVMNKIIRIENMHDSVKNNQNDNDKLLVAKATVRKIRDINVNGGSDALLEGGFGSDISRLTELMIQ